LYTKASIWNISLGALLLQRRIVDPNTDASNEAKVLNTFWEAAFWSALADMDLDATSSEKALELLESQPNDLWAYAYKYPSTCAFLRRIQSGALKDSKSTHIQRRVGQHIFNGVSHKAIFTNQESAIIEYIPTDIKISSLNASAGLAIGYKLAHLASPLITGKGSQKLKESIWLQYNIAKADAQKHDKEENFDFNDPEVESEFVQARLE
jgi:hypothetical protein